MSKEVQLVLGDHAKARRSRIPAYLLLALGGVIIWIDPTRNVEPVPWYFRWVWASFIVFGGIASAWGAKRDKWIFEYVCLWPLIAGFGLLVVVLCAGEGSTGRYAFACWLSFIVWVLWKRWKSIRRFVQSQKKPRQAGGEP